VAFSTRPKSGWQSLSREGEALDERDCYVQGHSIVRFVRAVTEFDVLMFTFYAGSERVNDFDTPGFMSLASKRVWSGWWRSPWVG
jgi:hypothetical protein